MLSIDSLREFGADVEDGLKRCMNNEAFYLKLVARVPGDANFDKLRDATAAGDLDAAFVAAHTIKGIAGNLSLTPIAKPVIEITELLRDRKNTDYAPLTEQVLEARNRLAEIVG